MLNVIHVFKLIIVTSFFLQINRRFLFYFSEASLFTDPRVEQAMLAVDRGDFAPSNPYEDSPQGIGHRATISAPHMVIK